jgi:hypothetical protein
MDAAPVAATLEPMAKQSKKPADLNRLAAAIVGDATDEAPQEPESAEGDEREPAAVTGRRGGLKGGRARAANMTAAQRSEAARKAARARWKRD